MREAGVTVGAGRPTINDVARLAGVSKKTVSRVINDSPQVQARTRQAVQAIIEKTGYVPDPHARSLALGKALLIGLVYERGDTTGVLEIQQGLLDGLTGSGFELVVRCFDHDGPELADGLRAFADGQKLFGLVLAPSMASHEALNLWLMTLNCRCLPLAPGGGRDPLSMGRAAAQRLVGPKAMNGTAEDAGR